MQRLGRWPRRGGPSCGLRATPTSPSPGPCPACPLPDTHRRDRVASAWRQGACRSPSSTFLPPQVTGGPARTWLSAVTPGLSPDLKPHLTSGVSPPSPLRGLTEAHGAPGLCPAPRLWLREGGPQVASPSASRAAPFSVWPSNFFRQSIPLLKALGDSGVGSAPSSLPARARGEGVSSVTRGS